MRVFSSSRLLVAAFALASASARMECPGSKAFIHAKAMVRSQVFGTCSEVMAEMEARVAGQFNKWHDPHNNGTYTLLQSSASKLEFSRLTGNEKYTDLLTFTFQRMSGNTCYISGCSESQVFSIRDYSTNFCNLYNLFCNKGEGCHPVLHDLRNSETSVTSSIGAGKDKDECLQVRRRLFML
uniref:Uncharacterized protein n=1 Tax=Alexandrium catenella TaxID=2925 RepID=A0A7S1WG60_ALECA